MQVCESSVRFEVKEEAFSKEEVVKLLGKSVNTVKKHIGLTDNIRKLRVMLELEQQNRNRKIIINSIQDKLVVLSKQIQTNIVNLSDMSAPEVLPFTDPLDKLSATMEVTDIVEKEVQIEFAD